MHFKCTSSGLDAWYVTVLLFPPALPSTSLSSLVTLSKRTLADSLISVSSVTGVTLWHNASALTASWTRVTTVRRTYENRKGSLCNVCIALKIVGSYVRGHKSFTAKRYTNYDMGCNESNFRNQESSLTVRWDRQVGQQLLIRKIKEFIFGWSNYCSTE